MGIPLWVPYPYGNPQINPFLPCALLPRLQGPDPRELEIQATLKQLQRLGDLPLGRHRK